jgi:hypothetical protein
MAGSDPHADDATRILPQNGFNAPDLSGGMYDWDSRRHFSDAELRIASRRARPD